MKEFRNVEKYIRLLKVNKNLILTGAPGTGKTYLAKTIAEAMNAEYEFVQFHPSYDYTDFVEGLRPTPPDRSGNIGFERKNGVFKEFCKRSLSYICNNKENILDSEKVEEMIPLSDDSISKKTLPTFYKLYDELKKKIQNHNVILYTVYPRSQMDLQVLGNDILYNKGGSFTSNYINEDYVRKIFNYYRDRNISDITKVPFKEFCDIIGNTLNYTYYRGIVQELLNMNERYTQAEVASTSKIELDASKPILIDVDDRIEKAMDWLMGQNGVILKSIRSETEYTLVIKENNIYLRIPKGTLNYVNPKGVIRYLKTGEYDREHQTYEPSVGHFIQTNSPLFANNESGTLQHKDILPSEDNDSLIQENNRTKVIKSYVFIIDEINRGEISKIFGELFFSIDPGYRGETGRVKTQYQNLITDESDLFYKGFYVPENVYIIGTMNDIDRSVESMDFAMRRRFAWVEVKADENTGMLDELVEMKDEVISVMERLNAAIWDIKSDTGIEGLSPAYHIGGAYFSKLLLYLDKDHTNKEEAYRTLWENHLKGILFEYLRGTVSAMDNLKMLERIYYNEENYDDIEG